MNQQNSYMTPNLEITPNKRNLNQNEQKHLLFFSQYCKHSNQLLEEMNKKGIIDKVELVCVDNRFTKDNIIYVVLQNQQSMPIPPMINSVPTLCITPNHEILKGGQILPYFVPISKTLQEERNKVELEPNTFDLNNDTTGSFGVSSDHFSFWDTNHEDLSASGNGGMKQMYSYASIENDGKKEEIYTPQEQTKETNNMTLEQLQQQRQSEL